MSGVVPLTVLRLRVTGRLRECGRGVVLLGWGGGVALLGCRRLRGTCRRVRGGVLAGGDWGCGGGLLEWRSNREAKPHLIRLADIDGAKAAGAESDCGSGGIVGFHCAYGASQAVVGNLCGQLQHPRMRHAETAYHDATPKRGVLG